MCLVNATSCSPRPAEFTTLRIPRPLSPGLLSDPLFLSGAHYVHARTSAAFTQTEVLTLFRLPGPVLIMVYKLSPELLESGKGLAELVLG